MSETTYGLMQGRYPAIVRSYDQARRTCRVEIPGLTDGTDTFSKAEIEYPVGDKAAHGQYPTEIEILPGDTVWIAFIGGDPRYPIITGYRNPQAGNSVDWRRYHHKNYELICDRIIRLLVGNSVFQLNPDTITGVDYAGPDAHDRIDVRFPDTERPQLDVRRGNGPNNARLDQVQRRSNRPQLSPCRAPNTK